MSDPTTDVPTNALAASTDAAEARWLERWIEGPTLTRWEGVPPQIGDRAPDFELLDDRAARRPISASWADGPALLVFWRHFGCGCGVDRAARLRAEMADYEAAGLEVVIIGQGDPLRARAYRDEHRLPVPILVDGSGDVYRAYGLLHGDVQQVLFDAPESMWSHDRASGEAFIAQRRASGRPLVDDPWMLPGEFVVDGSGVIEHIHRYQHCEDFPDPRVHVAAAKRAA